MAEATGTLVSTLDVRDALRRLAQLVVPSLGDWVCFTTAEHDVITDVVTYHRDGHEAVLDRLAELLPASLTRHSLIRNVLERGEPIRVERFGPEDLHRQLDDPELIGIINELGVTSGLYVPLLSRRNRTLGALAFFSGDSERIWDPSDLEVAADLGRRAGLSIDNARHYQQEHRAAETLQRSLLPELPDGTCTIAVGDVVGHDLAAAAAMGHLRILLRSIAWEAVQREGAADPALVLDRTDELVQALSITSMATVLFARLTRPVETGGTWLLAFCNATPRRCCVSLTVGWSSSGQRPMCCSGRPQSWSEPPAMSPSGAARC
ncbi:MAG: SpoIIE family protein phosphatase [Actinomycetota bacterium]|nr:SpoIIE family protein phosphatase [Actinomycetota bacterium]